MSETESIEILLVEDNPGDVHLAREAFRDAEVSNRLNWVSNGIEALAFLRREGRHSAAPRPDVVLLDLKMPRKDGREFLEELRRDEAFDSMPVVVLTSSFAEEDRLKAVQLRANAFLTKPLDLDDFVAIARSIYQMVQTSSRSCSGTPVFRNRGEIR